MEVMVEVMVKIESIPFCRQLMYLRIQKRSGG